jgi:hypothetical protein
MKSIDITPYYTITWKLLIRVEDIIPMSCRKIVIPNINRFASFFTNKFQPPLYMET